MSDLDFSTVPADQLQAVLDEPALSPPEGVTPNFDHPPNEDAVYIFTLVLCLSLTLVTVIIRLYVKFCKTRTAHVGDYLIIPAFGLFILVIEGSFKRIAWGPGLFVHQWDQRNRDMYSYLFLTQVGTIFYGASILLFKTAILIEWLHLFVPRGVRNRFYWTCYAMMAVHITFYTSVLVAMNLACTPHRRIWDKTVPGHCIDIKAIHLISAVINLVLDLAILAVPQRVVWKLNILRRRKVAVSAMFAIGIGKKQINSGVITVALRIQALFRWISTGDMTYHFSAISLWATAEITVAILILCVPSVPSAFCREKKPEPVSIGIPVEMAPREKKRTDSWLFRTNTSAISPSESGLNTGTLTSLDPPKRASQSNVVLGQV
ncbi:hypothetical protein GGS20DRAFT_286605 [Poronia punctata]|nr:hypothetical protein GGS20DRAFT_286605 [Poronia punctata]